LILSKVVHAVDMVNPSVLLPVVLT
jgi:hypothetical protein